MGGEEGGCFFVGRGGEEVDTRLVKQELSEEETISMNLCEYKAFCY